MLNSKARMPYRARGRLFVHRGREAPLLLHHAAVGDQAVCVVRVRCVCNVTNTREWGYVYLISHVKKNKQTHTHVQTRTHPCPRRCSAAPPPRTPARGAAPWCTGCTASCFLFIVWFFVFFLSTKAQSRRNNEQFKKNTLTWGSGGPGRRRWRRAGSCRSASTNP